MKPPSLFLAAIVFLSAATAFTREKPDAPAPEAAPAQQAEVVVLHATNSKSGIAVAYRGLPQLKQPPFSAYDSLTLLKRTQTALSREATSLTLPTGAKLVLKLTDFGISKKGLRLTASVSKPNGEAVLPAKSVRTKPGDLSWFPGPKYKQGILVLGVRVKAP